ncbi:hypothetical protein [Paraoerskovia marina]|uniref:hypothetical protein n=1 Tax=Paraoerskovia marina TaxID=545619 RepID=UPI0005BD7B69|nr:hypothetical protein [Paraoerskovia marina]
MSAPAGATGRGFGRLLVAVYGIFAIASSARALYQIGTKLDEAPVAYLLSGFAALVYIVATVALARGTARWRTVAWWAVGVELIGVLVVGTLSIVDAGDFPEATVWSHFGQGYGYVPVVLPVVGLYWLWRTRTPRSATNHQEA